MIEEYIATFPHQFTSPPLPLSRRATRLSSPQSCQTKPKLYSADRSSGRRERGTLHNQDVGEVGRTSRSCEL
jgi:hypothetical protein